MRAGQMKQTRQQFAASQISCGPKHHNDVRCRAVFMLLRPSGFRGIRHGHDRNQGWPDSHLTKKSTMSPYSLGYVRVQTGCRLVTWPGSPREPGTSRICPSTPSRRASTADARRRCPPSTSARSVEVRVRVRARGLRERCRCPTALSPRRPQPSSVSSSQGKSFQSGLIILRAMARSRDF